MSYWYTKETDSYAKDGARTATVSYTRGGHLTEILYGQCADALLTGGTSGNSSWGRASGEDCPATGPSFFPASGSPGEREAHR
ncbi:hypothetical protein [Streptomyces purpurascens]|uniref:hypothetical protein n=1 Tax=Streptomyces purpurascens TaxID=1924 RepID=UPI0016775FBA|nr:hypothetical protein [Streptomyces purpurascens]MCE7046882.1 hypothetical protein [Streptomyces purpurascens]